MPLVSAFLVHGYPLPYLRPDNPPWRALDAAYRAAGAALAASQPDVIAVYSTQWIAVLDELWQTRPHSSGVHVDENWHEYGDLPFDVRADVQLANAIIAATPEFGVRSKPVDYDAFPIDTGTIIANNYLNPGGRLPLVIAANNVYHDWNTTKRLAAATVACANRLGRRLALVGVGGLSGTIFRHEIDLATDHIAAESDDKWNRRMLALIGAGDVKAVERTCPEYAKEARVDMGFKHLAWLLGGLGGRYAAATVRGYGPVYGSGAAVIEFTPAAPPAARRRPAKKAVAKRPKPKPRPKPARKPTRAAAKKRPAKAVRKRQR